MKHIPNLLTLANAICGMMAIYFIVNASNTGLAIALIAAALFDMLDGWAARKVGASSELGKQLDSLADAISFGATSGFLWSSILADYAKVPQPWAMLVGAGVTAASVYRLAVFNLREDGGKDFVGMPTPANALFALGLWSWMGRWDNWEWIMALEGTQLLIWHMALVSIAFYAIYWQNASFQVLSLKGGGDTRRKIGQYTLVGILAVMIPFFGALSISIVVFLLPIISAFALKSKA
ncbi:MAG: CDP-alcohol phosphatidyltransferase family protein [Schleiferiaceae bacterium]